MGLIQDIEQLGRDFKKYSWPMKLLLLVFFFLSVSSIASLSDKIIEWKGFFKEGLEFYQLYVRGTIVKLFGFVTIDIPHSLVDLLVISSYYLQVSNESFHVFMLKDDGRLSGKFFDSRRLTYYFNLTIFSTLLVLIFRNSDSIVIGYWTLVILGLTIFSCTLFVLISRRSIRKARLYFLVKIIFPIFLVLILAAINAGLKG